MKILEAKYGNKDCTKELQAKVANNSLRLRVDNSLIGDPLLGKVKHLWVKYELKGKELEGKWQEGTFCVISGAKHKRLGIFYSNNNRPETQATIIKSLDTIRIAAEGKADILTCMWQPQKDNPFVEYIAWTKTYSHLNQLLQIMQLLYTAKETGKYESVSFLEHDVLYPEDYFDYETPKRGQLLCNMNYIGMSKGGFQDRKQHDQPFHQMTMRFIDAIKHCEKILANALIRNAGMIEPELERTNWQTKNPSVHVNHGHHFTSHYSIYSDKLKTKNDYWGDIKKYQSLFP